MSIISVQCRIMVKCRIMGLLGECIVTTASNPDQDMCKVRSSYTGKQQANTFTVSVVCQARFVQEKATEHCFSFDLARDGKT